MSSEFAFSKVIGVFLFVLNVLKNRIYAKNCSEYRMVLSAQKIVNVDMSRPSTFLKVLILLQTIFLK